MTNAKPRGAAQADTKKTFTDRIRDFFATEGVEMEKNDSNTWRTMMISVLVALITGIPTAVGAGIAFANVPADPTPANPWIASDKDDYPPGGHVTLTGGNWQPGESVHIFVDDDQTKTWTRNVDVTADENGNITDSFNLPDWFVATYTVEATGTSGARATTTFTDGNLTLVMADADSAIAKADQTTVKWTVTWDFFEGNSKGSNTTCSGTGTSGTAAYTGDTADSKNSQPAANEYQSIKLKTVSVTSSTKYVFDFWSTEGTAATKTSTVCLAGAKNLIGTYHAHFKLAQAETTVSAVSGTGTYGGSASLTATLKSGATNLSGKTVSFKLNNAAACGAASLPSCPTTNADGVATLTGVSLSGINGGTYADAVAASFTADSTHLGSSSSGTLSVAKADGSVTINNIPSDAVYGGSFTPTYTKSGNGTALTTSKRPSICSVSNGVVSFDAAGTCTLQASVTAGDNHKEATGAEQGFSVAKANQAITFGQLSDKTYGAADFTVSATGGDSGNAVRFTVGNVTDTCTVNGSTVTVTGVGSCTVVASQAGNDNYNAATDVSRTFTINKANQSIMFAPLQNRTVGTAPFTLSATGGESGNAVTFAAKSGSSCSVSGDTVTLTGAGTCTVVASQAGNNNYNAAADVEQAFSITYGRDGGIRQPINPDNNSVFSRGKSVPVKFGLANDAPTGFSTSTWTIRRVGVTCPGTSSLVSEVGEQEALSASSAGWRYDAEGDQYIFNMSFSDVNAGTCWKARVNFNDGSPVLDSAIFKIGK